jgi:predicted porin
MHKRKLLTAAVAAALGSGVQAAAFAQNVEIYGRLYPEITNAKATGATAAGTTVSELQSVLPTGVDLKSRNSVDTSNSRVGFRGREDLGSGLRALWQIETTVNFDAGVGTWATRDSFVGMGGGFGTIKLGNMDTVYKNTGDPIRFMNIASGNFVSTSNIISKTGFGTSSASSFHLRQRNSVYYDSPRMGGVQVSAQFSPHNDESKGGAASTRNLNQRLWSFGADYRAGGLRVGVAHEIHNDFFGASNNVPAAVANPTNGTGGHSKDRATRAAALYAFGMTRVSFDVSRLEYKEDATAAGKFEKYQHTTWAVVWEQRWGGPWRTTAAYASSAAGSCSISGAACSTTGLAGKLLALGGEYSLSKRTALFLIGARLQNGESATYNNLSQTAASPDVPTGADITQIALGVRHDL